MKTFNELTHEQKVKAWHKAIDGEIQFITELGEQSYKFCPHIASKIKEAVDEAERMRTPWFFSEMLLEKLPFSIPKQALIYARTYLYSEMNDPFVVTGIC